MKQLSVALMIYGDINSEKDALTDDKYKDLASVFSSEGFEVKSVLYHDNFVDRLEVELLEFNAVLVWVNPIEEGKDRINLDALLTELSSKGCFVSTHPEIISKIGTKDVLYRTKDMEWGGDTKIYTSFEDFVSRFYESLRGSGTRVLKRHRGNGGNGVFKVIHNASKNTVTVIHAKDGKAERVFLVDDFYDEFKPYFLSNGVLIDQEWNANIINGMVRCYLTSTKVSGFGYQEINALYPSRINSASTYVAPSRRFYFTENCGLFDDLKEVMEDVWVPQLQESQSMKREMMPVIWDADFFINTPNLKSAKGKYTLCEINVSCVSPFPPSSIQYIVEEVKNRI
jgi:hypothetical protein